MNPIAPRFGSIYVLKMPRKPEKCESPEQYHQVSNAISQATGRIDSKDPVTVSAVGGINLTYPVTLPTGEKKQVLMKADEGYAVIHIVSGIDKDKPDCTVNRELPKAPLARLKNWWRKTVQKKAPLSVEALSDQKVEAILNQFQAPFEKLSFEEAGK